MTDDPLFARNEHEDYLRIAKMREAAELVHGRKHIEEATEVYRRMRAELQSAPHLSLEHRRALLLRTSRIERKYGYEVLAGIPRAVRGSHPRHNWRAEEEA